MLFDPSVVQSLPMVANGSNPGFADRVLDLFVQSAVKLLTEVDDAANRGDAPALQRAAHTLKLIDWISSTPLPPEPGRWRRFWSAKTTISCAPPPH